MITAEELRERLLYEPDTGEWLWLRSPRGGQAGKPAGWIDAYGYKRIKIDGQTYIAARLSFLYMTGEWPKDEVDHIDRDPGNDKWENLREANRSENNSNRRAFLNNTSGHKGVYLHSQNSKYVAQVGKVYIGSFDTQQEAIEARNEFVEAHQGEFAGEQKDKAS
jgi:hypothetical protein